MDTNGSLVFKILTLNCWGLLYVSKHRRQRIKSISQHINEQDYDFVFLQEIWCQSDFDYIRTTTASKFKFAHLYKASSLLGNSGLVILSKWEPSFVHFEPFALNGSPYRPWHGDYFVGKGVAYARVHFGDTNIHLFGCHMHAQYSLDEEPHNQYSIHRICQAYQLAKFINLIGSSFTQTSFRDLFILAGDLNTASNDLPYRLLVQMTGLTDSYMKYAVHRECDFRNELNINFAARYFFEDINLTTCGHHSNSFTGSEGDQAKRIDFIMYKLLRQPPVNVDTHYICTSDRVECHGKDMDIGLSYSDHQPVAVQLKLRPPEISKTDEDSITTDGGDLSVPTKHSVKIDSNSKCVVETRCLAGDGSSIEVSTVSSEDHSTVVTSSANENVSRLEESYAVKSSENITRCRVKKTSNVSLETADVGRRSSLGTISAELKKVAIAAASKLYPRNHNSETQTKFSVDKETWYLRRAYELVDSYLSSSFTIGQRWLFYVMTVVFGVLIINLGSEYLLLSETKLYAFCFAYAAGALFLIILAEVIHRFEQNAIRSMAEDMKCTLHILENVEEPKCTRDA